MRSSRNGAPTAVQITEAVLDIVSTSGIDDVSIREVADRVGVAIGTVQHHFPTKDALLRAAYEDVLARIAERVERVADAGDPDSTMTAVLRELLPLDERRLRETLVHHAFAARAATSPQLAEIQRTALDRLRHGLAEAFSRSTGAPEERCVVAAHAVAAVADGLALHAVSAPGWLSERAQRDAVALAVDAISRSLRSDPAGRR